MLVGQEQIAPPFSPMGRAISPTLCMHMLRTLSIATGKGPKVLVAIASLEAQPCLLQLILATMGVASSTTDQCCFFLFLFLFSL